MLINLSIDFAGTSMARPFRKPFRSKNSCSAATSTGRFNRRCSLVTRIETVSEYNPRLAGLPHTRPQSRPRRQARELGVLGREDVGG
jgi:hypothetical protein